MAEDQNDCNNAENGQIPEEKEWEMSNRDEFGDYNTETGQVARDQQQNQGHTDNNQELAGNNSGARDAAEPYPGRGRATTWEVNSEATWEVSSEAGGYGRYQPQHTRYNEPSVAEEDSRTTTKETQGVAMGIIGV